MTQDLDPVAMLTDDATVAQWNNEGLPGDKMSTQNATILTNCQQHHVVAHAGRVVTVILSMLGVFLQVSAGRSSSTPSFRASSGSRADVAAASRL